jgi:hypothetical protein
MSSGDGALARFMPQGVGIATAQHPEAGTDLDHRVRRQVTGEVLADVVEACRCALE